jgi:hypothetical protein
VRIALVYLLATMIGCESVQPAGYCEVGTYKIENGHIYVCLDTFHRWWPKEAIPVLSAPLPDRIPESDLCSCVEPENHLLKGCTKWVCTPRVVGQ